MKRAARVKNSPFIQCLRDTRISNVQLKPTGSRFSLRTPEHGYPRLEIPLAGRHQLENAVLAVRTLEECSRRGLRVSPDQIVEGLRSVRWPGRFEKISDHPAIFVDGAHNPAGARALRILMESVQGNRKLILIYGAMRDKAIRKVLRELLPLSTRVIFTQPFTRRAASPEEIFSIVGEPGCPSYLTRGFSGALKLARRLAGRNSLILVAGSLYLVGEARKRLNA
jgi:dihydrofolate synthase / folylpolyglutamate synthase